MQAPLQGIIIDDEQNAIDNLNIMLAMHCSHIEIVASAQNTERGEQLIKELKPDIVFLDIEMPHENGIEFIKRISPINFALVFVTAYDEYAIKTFRLNALDYILKPISSDYLNESMERITKQFYEKNKSNPAVDQRLELYSKNKNKECLTLFHKSDYVSIPFSNIVYIEAQGAYSKFKICNMPNISSITSSYNLAHYEDILPKEIFVRVHRGYLANMNQALKIENELTKKTLTLSDQSSIPISRRKLSAIKKAIN